MGPGSNVIPPLFDLIVAAALVGLAVVILVARELYRSIVVFIVFGVMMAIAWIRLDAPDIALAEAAIGAGLTGALLLDALGQLRAAIRRRRRRSGG